MSRYFLLLAIVWVGSCFTPEIEDGQFTCAIAPNLCPEELVCQADCVCRDAASEPPAGSPTDCAALNP
jgi:hypothetical protein